MNLDQANTAYEKAVCLLKQCLSCDEFVSGKDCLMEMLEESL